LTGKHRKQLTIGDKNVIEFLRDIVGGDVSPPDTTNTPYSGRENYARVQKGGTMATWSLG
jgi:hypothetical protein